MDPRKVQDLRIFVETIRANPAVLQMPELAFFRDYLHSLGATLPKPKPAAAAHGCHGCHDPSCEPKAADCKPTTAPTSKVDVEEVDDDDEEVEEPAKTPAADADDGVESDVNIPGDTDLHDSEADATSEVSRV